MQCLFKKPSGLVRDDGKRPDDSTLHWYLGLRLISNQWRRTSTCRLTRWPSPTFLSLPPGSVRENIADRQKVVKILVSAILPILPTSGCRCFWTSRRLHYRHFISSRAGSQSDRCFRRPTWNDASLPAMTMSLTLSLAVRPALQFGCFHEDLGDLSVPTELECHSS